MYCKYNKNTGDCFVYSKSSSSKPFSSNQPRIFFKTVRCGLFCSGEYSKEGLVKRTCSKFTRGEDVVFLQEIFSDKAEIGLQIGGLLAL